MATWRRNIEAKFGVDWSALKLMGKEIDIMDIKKLYDAVVIGGGPAGLTAALYLARARYRILVIEKDHFGGQIVITSKVVNYPGVMETSGTELTETMRRQAQNFGAEFLLAEVTGLELDNDIKTVHTSRGDVHCFGILYATGAHPRRIGFQGEAEFQGHGVAYCATCDGEFFTGKEVFVIGGGFAAAEESVFLTQYAKHVTVLVREPDFTCAAAVAEDTKNHEKITVHYNTEVDFVAGDTALRTIRYHNNETGEITEYRAESGDTFGVFVFAGYEPATKLLQGIVELDSQRYVITDRDQKTNVDGVYAAGDVSVKKLRQVVTAVGDGAVAATELERYLAAMRKKTGMYPEIPVIRAEKSVEKAVSLVSENTNDLFSDDIKSQLNNLFSQMTNPLKLKLYLDNRSISRELQHYTDAIAACTDKLTVEITEDPAVTELPCVRVCREDGEWTGLAFHGVPGGHEFTSFVLGIYNVAGSGQEMENDEKEDIAKITTETKLQVFVSLSCTMCPELVIAAQHIAAENPHISAEIYVLNHFPNLKEQYHVMSVPCLVVNEEHTFFGKKNRRQLLDLLLK